MSVLKISVDGRYCLGVIGGFWLFKGQMRGGTQKFNNYRDNSLIVIMSLNMHSPSANPDSVPSADSHAKTVADRILYQKISRGVVPRGAKPKGGSTKAWPWLKGNSGCNPGRSVSSSGALHTARDGASSQSYAPLTL